jgi:hypothetical protein
MMVVLFALLPSIAGCNDGPVGMSLLFQSAGRDVLVQKFDFDGQRGPAPGGVGGMSPRGGAQMAFMPGDSKRPVPREVEVEWLIWTDEYNAWDKAFNEKPGSYMNSPEGQAEYKREWAKNPRYKQRIDLTPIVTPALLAKVRADRRGSLLKLIITFNNDQVDIKAEVEKWR